MDNAIRFKESRLSGLLYVICSTIACYSIVVANLPFSLQLIALIGLALLIRISIRQSRQSKGLRGPFRLTPEGLISIEDNLERATDIYQVRLLQRLPWCLNIELKHSTGKFRQLIWKDSIDADDWRRFRVYLAELP